MSNFELFEQLEYERNCSERVSPRRTRNNKLLPPECQPSFSSSCGERVSPRRLKGLDCLDFFGGQQPSSSPTSRQSSTGVRSFTVTARNNGSSNGSRNASGNGSRNASGNGSRNGSGNASGTTLLTETVSVTEVAPS